VSRLALVVFAALLLLPGGGRMGAMDSTDARYLAIAREMARDGEWIVPTLAGVPHLDKPPLAYWASSFGERIVGAGELGGRLTQQIALLATALVAAWAAERFAGRRWSLAAGLATLTAGLGFVLSRGAATDLLQLAFVSPALVLLHEGAMRRSDARVCAAFALLGASMWAKGPIALLVVAAVWSATAAVLRGRARLPLRGVAAGLVAFAVIGFPWYVLLERREPGVFGWFMGQLAGRVSGNHVGHVKDATYLVRAWLAGLLPWTPVVLLSLWRLRPRRPWRDADPVDVFLVAWTGAPVVLFSLFATKLASYIVPVVPAAALAMVRAASTGRLDDRAGRISVSVAAAATVLGALALGGAILAESQLGWRSAHFPTVHAGTAPLVFGAALVAIGALGLVLLPRAASLPVRRAVVAIAIGAGCVYAAAFHAVAADLPTMREEGRIVARVPGSRLVAFGFRPGLFYYAEPAATVYVAGITGLVEPFVAPERARRLALSRAEALAMLREDVPTFAWIDDWQEADLAALADTRELRRAHKYALVANPAAMRALAERGGVR
jgi:4-amino-4-deoxy-L-arabinose transferase-like glycosyltransferase